MAEKDTSRIIGIIGLLEEGELFSSDKVDLRDLSEGFGLDYNCFAFGPDENGDPYHRYREVKTGKEYFIVQRAKGTKILRTS